MGKIRNGFKNGYNKAKNWCKSNAYWIKPAAGAFLLSGTLIAEGYIAGKNHTERKYHKIMLEEKAEAAKEAVLTICEAKEEAESKEEGSGYSMKFFDANGNQYGDAIPCYKSYADDMFDCVP